MKIDEIIEGIMHDWAMAHYDKNALRRLIRQAFIDLPPTAQIELLLGVPITTPPASEVVENPSPTGGKSTT